MPARRGRKARRRRKKRHSSRLRRQVLGTAAAALLVGAAWFFWPFWQLSGQFDDQPLRQPSRLYGRSTLLRVGDPADPSAWERELESLGYRRRRDASQGAGEFASSRGMLAVHLRKFPTAYGWNLGGPLVVEFSRRGIGRLRWRGAEVDHAFLEPPLLASYYGPDRRERRPVELDELPETLVHALLAAEDASFFHHPGLSLSGMARAAWTNLLGGEVRQGGSTLTQQLAKNLFLSHDRTLGRKLREVVLALLIELRYDKRAILAAYLNEIYWGASGSVNLMGVGAASWVYFGKSAERLTLCESAVLAGMIASPGSYSPVAHPQAARARRDWVLGRMAELGWLAAERAGQEMARPLCVDPHSLVVRQAAYFADAAALEAERRFGVGPLADAGYVLLSTLRSADQQAAEEALAWGLVSLEKGWENRGSGSGPLQAALVSLDPRSGALLAYVGGRDYGASQFDRASQARRQAGSAFKPVVYAAAFEEGYATPSTLLEDAPLTVALAGSEWSPRNADADYRGWVSARTALEESLNVPTARLALEVGLRRVVETARRMGVSSRLQPVPALALGAFEVTPVELATVYATLAAGGVRRELYGLRGVLDREGRPVTARALRPPQRALSEETAYFLVSMLQGVLERGTGASARLQGVTDPLAGKTGTTNGRRDSWFVGLSPDRTTLVWVGYDDNSRTRLSGARAALPIWGRFTWAVRPAGGYPRFAPPAGIVTAVIDPRTGELATDLCPRVMTEVFRRGEVPAAVCHLHGGWYLQPDWRSRRLQESQERSGWRWLRRLLKSRKRPPV